MFARSLLVGGVLVSLSVAVADPLKDDEMKVVNPGRVADRAEFKPGRIAWCAPGKWTGEVWDHGRLRRATDSAITSIERSTSDVTYLSGPTLEAVEHLCQHPDDKGWQKQVMYLYQSVMNSQQVTQDEAVVLVNKWITAGQAAREKENRPKTDEDRFEFPEHAMGDPVKPEYATDTAKITGTIPWCDKAGTIKDRWEPGRIGRTIDSKYGIEGTIEGAYHLCQRPNDTTWKLRAQYVLQKWMNWTAQPQDEAVASIRIRMQTDKLKEDTKTMCKALEVSPEIGGQALAYAKAHQTFFGCGGGEELWRKSFVGMDDQVGFYFDADTELESEIVRLYWLLGQTSPPKPEELPGKDASANRPLLEYAVASQDFAAIDTKALDKKLRTAPFNNDFARTVVSESLAVLRWRRKVFEEAIDKLSKSASDYAQILRDAPKKGFADWEKVSAAWKAELGRSYAFEKKLSNPSRKVLQGCSKELMPDVQKLIKSYKKTDYNDLIKLISSDPIASLLLSRLAICFAAEKVLGGSGAMRDLAQNGRSIRGPRSMVYYAVVDAVTEAVKDRPKLLVNVSNFYFRMPSLVNVYASEFSFSGGAPREPETTRDKGAVKEAKKDGDGLKVVFKTQKYKYPEYNCVDTRKPIRISNDGRIEYEQNCTATGKMLSQDNTPAPVTISPQLATGVKPGAFLVTNGPTPVYVKKKGDDKKIQTFFGFAL